MRFIPCLLAGALISPLALGADSQSWLLRLQEAEQRQEFQGAFVYERNGSFSSHEIHRQVRDGQVREHILQLDGAFHESLRSNGRLECMTGPRYEQIVENQANDLRRVEPRTLAQWYDIRTAGLSRVAGRETVVLSLRPRDQHRYGFELYLDRETALPLKSLLLNENGQPLERFQYIVFEPVAQASLQAGQACRPVTDREVRPLEEQAWRSEWLPAGFALTRIVEQRASHEDPPVAWLVYGDGLARFSVFLEPWREGLSIDQRSQLGPTAAVSRRLATDQGDLLVTVIGEIPLGTAERVALSIRSGSGVVLQ
jgi:sigma-E factor negative regulatory protein RseB